VDQRLIPRLAADGEQRGADRLNLTDMGSWAHFHQGRSLSSLQWLVIVAVLVLARRTACRRWWHRDFGARLHRRAAQADGPRCGRWRGGAPVRAGGCARHLILAPFGFDPQSSSSPPRLFPRVGGACVGGGGVGHARISTHRAAARHAADHHRDHGHDGWLNQLFIFRLVIAGSAWPPTFAQVTGLLFGVAIFSAAIIAIGYRLAPDVRPHRGALLPAAAPRGAHGAVASADLGWMHFQMMQTRLGTSAPPRRWW